MVAAVSRGDAVPLLRAAVSWAELRRRCVVVIPPWNWPAAGLHMTGAGVPIDRMRKLGLWCVNGRADAGGCGVCS